MSSILVEDRSRFVLYPIKHNDIFDMYKKSVASFWTAEEVDLSKDLKDWEALNDDERHFIESVLAFFAASDGIVNDNLASRFMHEVMAPEARAFYAFQIAMETVHGEVYGLLLDTYVKDPEKRALLFDAINTVPAIKGKAEWALRWIEDDAAPFAQRLVAFAIVEGIFFSGSFASVYWLKERGILPGLCFSNELISRDEALHTEFAVLLHNDHVDDKPTTWTVHQMVREAVELEKAFVGDAIQCHMIGMSAPLMRQYIEFVADRLLQQLGHPKLYNAKNPFPFMERISVEGKTNFFERRVSEYSLANVTRPAEFKLDSDF
jgi:ribonucleotide reductase beta subunit family protein with ferritin-like domain